MVVLTPPGKAWVECFRAHLHASLLGESAAIDAGWFDLKAAAIVMSRTQRWEPWPEVEEAHACLTTIMKLSGSASAGVGDDGHLQVELHQSGPAAKWARQAGARVLGWREYDLAKPRSEVALLAGPADQTRLLAVALADATRARMVTVLPGDVAALLSAAERVHFRSGRVKRGTAPLLVYIEAMEFVAAPGSPGRAVLSGLLKAAAAGAATVVVGATDGVGGIDTDMLDRWGPVRHIQSRPNVRPWLHPDIKTAH